MLMLEKHVGMKCSFGFRLVGAEPAGEQVLVVTFALLVALQVLLLLEGSSAEDALEPGPATNHLNHKSCQ